MVEDERARNWIVYEGDMGWQACDLLTKLGLTQVVLPSDVLLYGRLPLSEGWIGAPLDSVTPDLLDVSYDLKVAVRRLIRLNDCAHYLRGLEGNTIGNS